MSNPCRIKCFGQELVVYRDDLMARMLRNLVGVKPDVQNDDLKRFVSIYRWNIPLLTTNLEKACTDYN